MTTRVNRNPSALKSKVVKVNTPQKNVKKNTPVLSLIDSMPVEIDGEIHYLHFLDKDDVMSIKDKIHGYTFIDQPEEFNKSPKPSLISHKNGKPILDYSGPFTIIYMTKGKHYIHPGNIESVFS